MIAVDSKCPVLLIWTSREEFDKCFDGGTLIPAALDGQSADTLRPGRERQ